MLVDLQRVGEFLCIPVSVADLHQRRGRCAGVFEFCDKRLHGRGCARVVAGIDAHRADILLCPDGRLVVDVVCQQVIVNLQGGFTVLGCEECFANLNRRQRHSGILVEIADHPPDAVDGFLHVVAFEGHHAQVKLRPPGELVTRIADKRFAINLLRFGNPALVPPRVADIAQRPRRARHAAELIEQFRRRGRGLGVLPCQNV